MAENRHPEHQYLELLRDIMDNGHDRPVRNGMSRAVFLRTMRFNMADGFPALTTKKLFFNSVKAELLGFLHGVSNAGEFRELGTRIWDANANENEQWLNNPNRKGEDDLGRIYGVQWRSWRTALTTEKGTEIAELDQISDVLRRLKDNPYDRRLLVTAWNPGELDMMALPPCHMFFQFFVRGEYLDLAMYQRSCDTFLGVPFNIASYALLLHMVARTSGYKAGEFVHILGDTHIYHNHFKQVETQLEREPFPFPRLELNPDIKDIFDFTVDDIELVDYRHHPVIKADMNV